MTTAVRRATMYVAKQKRGQQSSMLLVRRTSDVIQTRRICTRPVVSFFYIHNQLGGGQIFRSPNLRIRFTKIRAV